MQFVKYSDLSAFLNAHQAKNFAGQAPTHTRIPDESRKIYGGSFVIPEDELEVFHALYAEHVFEKQKQEYLTERQIQNGPVLIDLDFRYKYEVETRPHKQDDIVNILTRVYLEILKELLVFTDETDFNIYVMEKPDVNRLADSSLTKDGIHIIIGIKMDHILQTMMRTRALTKIGDVIDLPLINSFDSVLDEGISKGTTNWQLYGSRKPGHQAYEITQIYNVTLDPADKEFIFDEISVESIEGDYFKLSAQNQLNPGFKMNPNIKQEYDRLLAIKQRRMGAAAGGGGIKIKLKVKQSSSCGGGGICSEDEMCPIDSIRDANDLDMSIKYMFSHLRQDESYLKEIHEYTQILPEAYYESGSHLKNREVAFALKNTDDRLFLSWIKLRSKASDFDYGEISELKKKWDKYFNKGGLTYKSIIYWAKNDASTEYRKIKEKTLDHYIDESIREPTDYNFAMILFHMFRDKYVCTSIQHKIWFEFSNHHWEQDKGESLRASISNELYEIFQKKRMKTQEEVMLLPDGSPEKVAFLHGEKGNPSVLSKILKIMHRFKTGSDKNNIFREACEIFYDKHFVSKMDANKYLMCFSNGVIDFKNKIFRDGDPLDYITKSTGVPYLSPDDLESNQETVESVVEFMQQLFPIPELNKYMWEHLSSTLIGENMNQTFNIYLGIGSNGKSMLMDLMGLKSFS